MVTRILSDYEEEHTHLSQSHFSGSPSDRATISSAQPVKPKPSTQDQTQSPKSRAKSVQFKTPNTAGSRNSSHGSDSGPGGEAPSTPDRRPSVLPKSTITFERRPTLIPDPKRDATKDSGQRPGAYRRDRDLKRFSFAVGREAAEGPVAETWQVFVEEEQLQQAAKLVEQGQTTHDPDLDELQSIVAALFEKNAALKHQIASMKEEEVATKRQNLMRYRRFLKIRMPGLLDKYDYESDGESDMEGKMLADAEHNLREAKRRKQHTVQVQHDEQFESKERNQSNVKAYDTPMSRLARRDSQDSLNEQHSERFKHRTRSQSGDETFDAIPDTTSDRPSSKVMERERWIEVEKQLEDLTKRHSISRRDNEDWKKKYRAIQVERDQLKFDNFKLQRIRSELLQMNNNMITALPDFRAVQTRNLRANVMYWENERARAPAQSLDQIPEEGSSSSTDTLQALMRNRAENSQHPELPHNPVTETETEDMDNGQTVYMPSDTVEVAVAHGITLRSRQGSTAPIVPGRGLEESRRAGLHSLKQRPNSIIHPAKKVRGLPGVVTEGPSQHPLTRSSSHVTDASSTTTADYSGKPDNIKTANQIDYTGAISQIPSKTSSSLAWEEEDSLQKYEHQNSPLSGLTPFFEMIKDPPIAFNLVGKIRYNVCGADERYEIREFKKGEKVFVYVDGMHVLWPVKPRDVDNAYVLSRNAIALLCDHHHEYTEMYEVIQDWDDMSDHARHASFMRVKRQERFFCAHSFGLSPGDGRPIEKYLCITSLNRQQKGLVPARVLQKMNTFSAAPQTASLCPCKIPQPYIGLARVLVDCGDSAGELSLKEGTEIDLSHLVPDLAAYCVRDPVSKRQGHVDANCLHILSNPVYPARELYAEQTLNLTPKFLDSTNPALKGMEVTSVDVQNALRETHRISLSNEAKERWDNNMDGTNPEHKKYNEEMAKLRPPGSPGAKVWRRWYQGPPTSDDYYVTKPDLEVIKKGGRWRGMNWNHPEWTSFVDTYPFAPFGPGNGTRRARSKSLPALRNPAYLSEKDQEREFLIKRDPHLGHQPHRTIADGACPDRDYMSEPITGEPHDLKRRYIYFKEDGSMLACEVEHHENPHDEKHWRNPHYPPHGTGFTAWRRKGVLLMPVEENVVPFSFETAGPSTGKAFGYVHEAPGQIAADDDCPLLDIFRIQQELGFELVYRLKRDPREIPILAVYGLTADDRFEITNIPGPEMYNVENFQPVITIKAVRRTENALESRNHMISASELDLVPFLRTAVTKGDPIPEHLMPQERDTFRFVLIRKRQTMEETGWDSLFGGQIVPAKLSMMELEHTKLWKPLNSVFDQIQLAYEQKEVMLALEEDNYAEQEPHFTAWKPQINEWDFFYPVTKHHTGPDDRFINIAGPDPITGDPADHVYVLSEAEEPGQYLCYAVTGDQKGLVDGSAIDLESPHLLMFQFLNSSQSPSGTYFTLLKEEGKMCYIYSEHHTQGWIDRQENPFDESNFQFRSLSDIFRHDIINMEDIGGAYAFMNHLQGNQPVEGKEGKKEEEEQGEKQKQRKTITGSNRDNPPLSLYVPRHIRESEIVVSTASHADIPTQSREHGRLSPASDDLTQPTHKSLSQDIEFAPIGSGDEERQSTNAASTSANNSDMSWVDVSDVEPHLLNHNPTFNAPGIPLLKFDQTPNAPEVPVQTKPTQGTKNNEPIPTNSGNSSYAPVNATKEIEGEPAAADPHDDHELMIRYDDWQKREEAFNDDTSTDMGPKRNTRPRENRDIGREPIQSKRHSDSAFTGHASQSGVKAHNSKKHRRGSKSASPSKRRRSESDQAMEHPELFSKRARSTVRDVSHETPIQKPTIGTSPVEIGGTSPSRRPSELAERFIRGSPDLLSSDPGVSTSRSLVSSYHEGLCEAPTDTGADTSSPRAISSDSWQVQKSIEDGTRVPGDFRRSPSPGSTVSRPRQTSLLDKLADSRSSRGRWLGRGQVRCNDVHNDPNSDYNELPGSPVSPIRVRCSFNPQRSRTRRTQLSTSHPQTIANISPTDSVPRTQVQDASNPQCQPLALHPVATTDLTISPIRSTASTATATAFTTLETTLTWLNSNLELLITLILALGSPHSTPTTTPMQCVPDPNSSAELRIPSSQTQTQKQGTKISRWTLIYMVVLGYLLFSICVARAEWLDVNGMGGIWGPRYVRGGHGRWVWGGYSG